MMITHSFENASFGDAISTWSAATTGAYPGAGDTLLLQNGSVAFASAGFQSRAASFVMRTAPAADGNVLLVNVQGLGMVQVSVVNKQFGITLI